MQPSSTTNALAYIFTTFGLASRPTRRNFPSILNESEYGGSNDYAGFGGSNHELLIHITVAYAILQLPRSVMPEFIKQEELVKLHRRLHHTSRAMQKREYEPLELLHISTL